MKKNLTLIVHADVQQQLADALRALPAVAGFTFTHVEGHGSQSHRDATLSARDLVVGYVPRVRVDILIEEEQVAEILAVLARPASGVAGRGVYWVTPVEAFGRM
jgi:nitrogen regulatory protein P-II 1